MRNQNYHHAPGRRPHCGNTQYQGNCRSARPIGFCARVKANSKAEAVSKLREAIPEDINVDALAGDVDAADAITEDDITGE